jgi:hypothetical protein
MSLNIAAIFEPEAATGTTDRSMVSVSLAAVETDAESTDRFERGEIDIYDVPSGDRPLDLSDSVCPNDDCYIETLWRNASPSERLGGLCSPPAKQFHPERLGHVLTVCDRCQSQKYVDVPIHDGTSIRRDCRQCFRFMGFPKWYDKDTPVHELTRETS